MADKAKRYTLEEIRDLAAAMGELGLTQKHDPASTTLTAGPLHGPFHGNAAQFGIFSGPGIRPEMFTALVRPHSLASILGVNQSFYTNERLEVMTGVTAAAGTNADGWCGDPPTVGQGKVCKQSFAWGEYYVKTDLNALPKLGELRNRADVPRDILNAAPAMRNPFIPDLLYRLQDTRSQLAYELWRIGVALELSMEHVLVQGLASTAGANRAHGWITEFDGLDRQIRTGYTDADSGLVCPAMDSMVISFNAEVDGTIGGGDGRNLVEAFTDLFWAAQDRASEMGMAGTIFAFVMRKEQFRAIVDNWVCQYATYRCTTTNNPTANMVEMMKDTNQLRIEMMNGQYLLIDGQQVPVVFSEGIARDGIGANHFKADVYLVPLSWQGMPLIKAEYFPVDNQYVNEFASMAQGMSEVGSLNNGLFIVGKRSTGFCLEWLFGARMRMILETPFLAGRVDDIRFTFRAPIRNADPADTWFYADGGITYRS
jgi:hypothetical protein